jgi:hypothetical protein
MDMPFRTENIDLWDYREVSSVTRASCGNGGTRSRVSCDVKRVGNVVEMVGEEVPVGGGG